MERSNDLLAWANDATETQYRYWSEDIMEYMNADPSLSPSAFASSVDEQSTKLNGSHVYPSTTTATKSLPFEAIAYNEANPANESDAAMEWNDNLFTEVILPTWANGPQTASSPFETPAFTHQSLGNTLDPSWTGPNLMWQHGLSLQEIRAHPEQTFRTEEQYFALQNPVSHGHLCPYERPFHRTPVNIGTIDGTSNLETIVFKCSAPGCDRKKFSRWQEFRRHYNGAHMEGYVFWCSHPGCERSVGGRPFPRKDKLNDHVRNMHPVNA